MSVVVSFEKENMQTTTNQPFPAGTGPGLIGLIWASVAAVFLCIGLGYLIVQGDQWYGQALSGTPATSWWAWPWSWPGPKVAEEIFSWMGMKPWDHHTDHVLRMFLGMPRFALAAMVNVLVAALPLLAVSLAVNLTLNTR
jgi:hypothetical protein